MLQQMGHTGGTRKKYYLDEEALIVHPYGFQLLREAEESGELPTDQPVGIANLVSIEENIELEPPDDDETPPGEKRYQTRNVTTEVCKVFYSWNKKILPLDTQKI